MKSYSYLIEYAKAQVGRPYWCGTYGQKANESLYIRKKWQLPAYYTAKDFATQYGQKVHDCCGLIKGALWCKTVNSEPSYNVKEDLCVVLWYDRAKEKGVINGELVLPEGSLVFRGSFGHMGVYSDGYIYHAKGHAYGVIKERYSPSNWTHWAKCHLFDYTGNNKNIQPSDIYKKGDKVRMLDIATVYGKKTKFSKWVYDSILYIREIKGKRAVVSVFPDENAPITGAVSTDYLVRV